MNGLMINLSQAGRSALIVGGGEVALRKAVVLLGSGFVLMVVSPVIAPELARMAAEGSLVWLDRCYLDGDLDGHDLIVVATDDRGINCKIGEDALAKGLLVNVVDAQDEGNFRFPAMFSRGRLQVAVSTGGASPAFASALRDELHDVVDESYGEALELLAKLREKQLTLGLGHTYNTQLVKKLFAAGLTEMLRRGDIAAAELLILQETSENQSAQTAL